MADNVIGGPGTSRRSPRRSESQLSTVSVIGRHDPDEFRRGPKWRTRTTSGKRRAAAVTTFALIVLAGAVLTWLLIWLLDWIGAPIWVSVLPWAVPAAGAVAWAMIRPRPAVATDDDDDSWAGYAIEYVIIGEGRPRAAPIRLVAAAVFGAPVAWALAVFGFATLVGLF